jgi:hypothetical protein
LGVLFHWWLVNFQQFYYLCFWIKAQNTTWFSIFVVTNLMMNNGNKIFDYQGAIIIKWDNGDKGFNHKCALFEHFDFFIERIFWRIFFQHVLKNIYNFLSKLHYLW